jgi:hypothetical protein
MTTQLIEFSQAIARILESLNLRPDQLNIRVPKGLWKKVCELLNTQEIKTERGKEWKHANCSTFFERHKKEIMDHLFSEFVTNPTELNLSEQHQPKRNQNHFDKVSKGTDIVLSEDSLTRGGISDAVKEEILELVRNEVERILINRTSLISSDSKYPIAPQAPLVGKKLSGERVKLGVTIDKILNQLLMDAAKELRQTYGQVIDNALWLYFSKPLLSFQKDLEE